MSELAGRGRKPRRPPDSASPFQPFLEQLLREIAPSARLLTLLGTPPDHYTLRIEVPGRASRALIVARETVERAATNPAALRALRGTLTAHLGPVGPANVVRGYRGTRIPPDTPCTVCGQPIREWERPAVKQARIMHARCATA
jgi:hypothetical protein